MAIYWAGFFVIVAIFILKIADEKEQTGKARWHMPLFYSLAMAGIGLLLSYA